MVFVANELVARIEAAECSLLADIIAGTRSRRPELDAWAVPIAGGQAGFAGEHAPVNKISGLGFGGLPDAELLAAVESRFHERAAPAVCEVASHADPALLSLLVTRGYRLAGFENVLGRALDPAIERHTSGVAVEEVAAGPAREVWFEALLEGFAAPDTQGVPSQADFPRDVVGQIMRDMAVIDGYRCYLARIGGQVAGGGALRLTDSVAHFCGAATLPSFRRRGVQSVLVGERLALAARAGCDIAVTVTQPGSTSQQNMQRLGFEVLYVRAVLVLEARTRAS